MTNGPSLESLHFKLFDPARSLVLDGEIFDADWAQLNEKQREATLVLAFKAKTRERTGGKPIPSVPLVLLLDGKQVEAGQTDADGIWDAEISLDVPQALGKHKLACYLVQAGSSIAKEIEFAAYVLEVDAVAARFTQRIGVRTTVETPFRSAFFAARNVDCPGFFAAISRSFSLAHIAVKGARQCRVIVSGNLPTGADGTAFAQFKLQTEPGDKRISIGQGHFNDEQSLTGLWGF